MEIPAVSQKDCLALEVKVETIIIIGDDFDWWLVTGDWWLVSSELDGWDSTSG